MRRRELDAETIVAEIRRVASEMAVTELRMREFEARSGIPQYVVRRRFDNWTQAVRPAGR